MENDKKNTWWGVPRRMSDRQLQRKISWQELFYDLVYAAAISVLTSHLATDTGPTNFGFFLLLFAMLFWTWVNGSYYHDSHGSEGVRSRYFTLLQMLAVCAVAITLPGVFAQKHQSFAIAFSVVQTIITYLWWSVGYYDPAHRHINRPYTVLYLVGLGLLVASIFVGFRTAVILWIVAVICDYGVVFAAAPVMLKEFAARGIEYKTTSSIIERFGLFAIIVMGESVFGIIHALTQTDHNSTNVWIGFILCMMIAFLLWWVYFDMLGESEARPGYRHFLIISFTNLPLLAGLAIIGSMVRIILTEKDFEKHGPARLIFGTAISVVLACISIIAKSMAEDPEEKAMIRKFHQLIWITLCVVGMLTFLLEAYNNITFISIIALVLLVPVLMGTTIWVNFTQRRKNSEKR